jgi:hypothetical protein
MASTSHLQPLRAGTNCSNDEVKPRAKVDSCRAPVPRLNHFTSTNYTIGPTLPFPPRAFFLRNTHLSDFQATQRAVCQLPRELHRHLITPFQPHPFLTLKPRSLRRCHLPLTSISPKFLPSTIIPIHHCPPPISRTLRRRRKTQNKFSSPKERVLAPLSTNVAGTCYPSMYIAALKAAAKTKTLPRALSLSTRTGEFQTICFDPRAPYSIDKTRRVRNYMLEYCTHGQTPKIQSIPPIPPPLTT